MIPLNAYLRHYLNSLQLDMNLFFSPPVRTYSLILQHHQAPAIIDKLISTGFVEFEMNPYDDSSDPFYIIYSRVRQLKFKISGLVESIEQKYKEKVPNLTTAEKQMTIGRMKDYIEDKQIDYLRYLDMEEGLINQKINRFNAMATNYDNIMNKVTSIQEQLDLVQAKLEIITGKSDSHQFMMLTGTCPRKDRHIIQKLIFRKTHGHSYIAFRDRNHSSQRDMFLCFINKGVYKNISNKINNIFNINRAILYDLPNMENHLTNYQQTLEISKKQYIHLLQISTDQFMKVLRQFVSVPESSMQYHFTRMAFLERIIYIICHSKPIGYPANHHMFTIHVPQNQKIPQLPIPLIPIQGKHKPRTIMPRIPCLYEVNILTELYSVPKYNQILPSIFMFSTVPILFGMMFSDMGHGFMLLSLAFFLKLGPIFYFMAFMSIYCGFIYNQFFGMKIISIDNLGVLKGEWGVAQNGLNFQNSLKMKLSMVIAFVHMSFGIALKMINELKRGQKKLFIYDSVPKFVLMFTTIGYLVYLILMKWFTDYRGRQNEAPSIINSVLQMYLGFNESRKISILGSIQREKQVASLLNTISSLCILVMVYNHAFRHKFEAFFINSGSSKKIRNKNARYQKLEQQQIDEEMNYQLSRSHEDSNLQLSKSISYYHEKQEHESELGALEVFQYILSLISSTTSYLRLFALSLAHSKLSHLLLNFLLSTLSSHQPSISILRCFVFFFTTIGMMLALDVMQCLMHVVRLHWVEWMGKFYVGTGILFQPEIEEQFS